jgi:hypothetical protein
MSAGEPLKVEGPSYSADDLATVAYGDIHAFHQNQTSPPSLEGSQQINGPDGGYGWVSVVCCCALNAYTWGVQSVKFLSDRFTRIKALSF